MSRYDAVNMMNSYFDDDKSRGRFYSSEDNHGSNFNKLHERIPPLSHFEKVNESAPSILKINEQAYRIIIKQNNQEIYKTTFSNKGEFEQFLKQEALNRKEISIITATFIPIRTNKLNRAFRRYM